MALRVLRALAAQESIGRVDVSSDDPALVTTLGRLAGDEGLRMSLAHHASGSSPAASVASYVRALRDGELALVTTADHPLLTPAIVRAFLEAAVACGADVVAGAVTETVYRARFPTGPRTFIRLADAAISGANLFLVRAPEAAAVADFWVRLEGVRKQPWRLVSHFGLPTLLRFAGRRLTIGQAADEASRRMGARVRLVLLPFAEAALDVDRPADLAAVEEVLADGRLENA
jgi:CTP:molybdopterin cytidylyltransferase MocA